MDLRIFFLLLDNHQQANGTRPSTHTATATQSRSHMRHERQRDFTLYPATVSRTPTHVVGAPGPHPHIQNRTQTSESQAARNPDSGYTYSNSSRYIGSAFGFMIVGSSSPMKSSIESLSQTHTPTRTRQKTSKSVQCACHGEGSHETLPHTPLWRPDR